MTADELKKQLDLGMKLLLMGRELKEIASMIRPDEIVGTGSTAQYGKTPGLLVATNKRLIYVSKVLLNVTVEEFYYNKISNIQYTSDIMFGQVEIYLSGSWCKFHNLNIKNGKQMADFIKQQINSVNDVQTTMQTTTIINQADPMEQLEKLSTLKEKGIITEEEFNVKKKQLLDL